MYTTLFNYVSDALYELERGSTITAARILRFAQAKTEDLFLDGETSMEREKEQE